MAVSTGASYGDNAARHQRYLLALISAKYARDKSKEHRKKVEKKSKKRCRRHLFLSPTFLEAGMSLKLH
ncbi:MAG: hypothetical protein ACI8PP_002825 [Candidatus Pseudothioglobus sp.]